jgi:hypothetical protein
MTPDSFILLLFLGTIAGGAVIAIIIAQYYDEP